VTHLVYINNSSDSHKTKNGIRSNSSNPHAQMFMCTMLG